MRVAVLGAGAVGSAAAMYLAADGHEVTVFEQFSIDHDRGSSHGASRIIRRTYTDALYTSLMDAAYSLWEHLERETGESLLVRCGGLFYGPTDSQEMVSIRNALRTNAVAHAVWTAREAIERYPQFILRPDETAVFERDAGYLKASACVRTQMAVAREWGTRVVESGRVAAIESRPGGLAIVSDESSGSLFDRVIVASGAWTAKTLAGRVHWPLRATRQVYCYFRTARRQDEFAATNFPVWIDFGSMVYGFPYDGAFDGVKVSIHVPGAETDPDVVRREIDDDDRKLLRDHCRNRMVGVAPFVVHEQVCLYTMTPDSDFIVDRVPDDDRIVCVAGLSGHGFKFTTLLGRIAAWMTTDATIPFDLRRFNAARFAQHASPAGT